MANEKYGIEGFSFTVKLMWVEIKIAYVLLKIII